MLAYLAADPTASDGVFNTFVQYGAVGLMALFGVWFARGAYQREVTRGERLEDENRRLNTLIVDRVIPALTAASTAAEEAGKLLNAMQREREVMREAARLRGEASHEL